MFIVYLWDKIVGESITTLEDFTGNEIFLIRSERYQYPLLSELSNCAMALFSDGQLGELSEEIRNLIKNEPLGQDVQEYLLSVISLIDQADSDSKSILFSPF